MSMALAVLDVSFNSGHYTVIIKRQSLYINICSFSTIFIYMFAIVHDLELNVTRRGSKFSGKVKCF